jgi:xanthine dehydrogenase molybdenum-binding subunit
MSQALNVVGHRKVRTNGVPIVTRTAEYSTDVSRPGMLYGRVLTSPYPHAKITAIDTSKAEALPGVKAVVTYKDAPKIILYTDMYLLEDEVRFVGDEVAAVAATDPFIAEEALDLIQVTYQQLPAVFTPQDALNPNAPNVHPEGNLIKSQSGAITAGADVDEAFAKSDHVVEKDGSTPRQPNAAIGLIGTVAEWSKDGSLTIWDSNQGTCNRRNEQAAFWGIPLDNVTEITPFCATGFGQGNTYRYIFIAALLAKKTQKPVKFEPGKAYQFAGSTKTRHPASGHVKIGINNDGTLTAIQMDTVWDKGAYAGGGSGVSSGAGRRTQNVYQGARKYTYNTAYTNLAPCGSHRGYGSPQGHFLMETAVNKAAEELGIDPVQIRLKSVSVTGFEGTTSCALKDCVTEGAAKFGWKWQPFTSKTDTGIKRRGVSCMVGSHGAGGSSTSQSAAVVVNSDGTAQTMISAGEIGTGIMTVLAQIAAEELGVKYEDVDMRCGNSTFPDSGSSSGSTATRQMGTAVQLAARDAKQQIFAVAAPMLKVTAQELGSGNGSIYVLKSPDQKLTFKDVMAKLPARACIGRASGTALPSGLHTEAYYAFFGEVEVDTETGEVAVIRALYADDCGTVVNPTTAENQIAGATMQSLGLSLSEEYVVDGLTGIPLTLNYLDYGLLTIADTPPLDVIFANSSDPYGPFGAKGLAESATVPPMAIVASAIYNAIGKWIDPPFTPAKVLKALGRV